MVFKNKLIDVDILTLTISCTDNAGIRSLSDNFALKEKKTTPLMH